MSRRSERGLRNRLLWTKGKFVAGWTAIIVALIGSGYVIPLHLTAGPGRSEAPATQVHTPAPPVDPILAARLAGVSRRPVKGEPPLLLTYHDINPDPAKASPYTLTPQAFAAQMALLSAAGYHTVSAADLIGWLDGQSLPARSVFISFDDGDAGIWKYADPVLAEHRFVASAFIVTGYIGGGRAHYVSWPEIEALGRSGRWDIEAHTRDGHRYVPTAGGQVGAFLVSRALLPGLRRLETEAEYERRVTTDLNGNLADLRRHGLPTPRLFAFPYSAAESPDPVVTQFIRTTTQRMFAASMLDDGAGGVTSPAELARRQLRRLNVLRGVEGAAFVAEVAGATPLPLAAPRSLARRTDLQSGPGHGSLAVSNETITLTAPARGWKSALYLPGRTMFWRDYELRTTVADLAPAGATGTVSVRTSDRRAQVDVSVSAGWYTLRAGGSVLSEGRLSAAPSHQLVVRTEGPVVRVTIDGRSLPDSRVPAQPGGIQLGVSTGAAPASVSFTAARVAPLSAVG
jgi:poly-beta-1,6-N-acetyl-D-glucosamine N-deacetylase